jgi:hypothetical protein
VLGKCIQWNKEGSFETLLQNMSHEKNNTAGFVSYNPSSTLPSTRIRIQNSGIISNDRFSTGRKENIRTSCFNKR